MDEKSDQIIEQVEAQRNQLGANLNELETRVRQTTDWRTHFDNNPMLMLGVALGGGVLLGAMVGGSKSSKTGKVTWSGSRYYDSPSYAGSSSSEVSSAYSAPKPVSPAVQQQKQHASETVDMIKAALIGFATAKAKEFLGQALPGFSEHLEHTEREHGVRQPTGTQTASNWGGEYQSPQRANEPVAAGTPS